MSLTLPACRSFSASTAALLALPVYAHVPSGAHTCKGVIDESMAQLHMVG